MKKALPYPIVIEADDDEGYIVTIGCKRFAFTDRYLLAAKLEDYLFRPDETVEKYFKEHESGGFLGGEQAPTAYPPAYGAPQIARSR